MSKLDILVAPDPRLKLTAQPVPVVDDTVRRLMDDRYSVYALADLIVQSREVPHDKIVDEIVGVLAERTGAGCVASSPSAKGDPVP